MPPYQFRRRSGKKAATVPGFDDDSATHRYALTSHDVTSVGGLPKPFWPPDGKAWNIAETKFSDDGKTLTILWSKPIEDYERNTR